MRCVLRLDPPLRFATYATFAALLATGAAWLLADQFKDGEGGESWQILAANLLMFHGGIAMIALVLFGALMPLHLQRSWRAGRNRATGTIMVATNAILIVTAFALYYAGSDALRIVVADIHIAAGFALPALIATHIVLGRRSRELAGQFRSRPMGVARSLPPVTFSGDRGSP
jgi:hypothetical protein